VRETTGGEPHGLKWKNSRGKRPITKERRGVARQNRRILSVNGEVSSACRTREYGGKGDKSALLREGMVGNMLVDLRPLKLERAKKAKEGVQRRNEKKLERSGRDVGNWTVCGRQRPFALVEDPGIEQGV